MFAERIITRTIARPIITRFPETSNALGGRAANGQGEDRL